MKTGESDPILIQSSFRDPAGRVLFARPDQGDVVRLVREAALSNLEGFLASAAARRLIDERKLVKSRPIELDGSVRSNLPADIELQPRDTIWAHERIPFVSYPYEWAPEMLHAAAELTLEIAALSLAEDFILKDATPYNVLYHGTRPVFVDLLSFERRMAGSPLWPAAGQFLRTFVLPLILAKHCGSALRESLQLGRDGPVVEQVFTKLAATKRFRRDTLFTVALAKWLGGFAKGPAIYQPRSIANEEKARFIIERNIAVWRRRIGRLRPPYRSASTWSDYAEVNSYGADDRRMKEAFVRDAIARFGPRNALDIGCNTGHYSRIVADSGASVVAIDADAAVVGALWTEARRDNLDILPLVQDISWPSPGMGWGNSENASFLDRARGAFDNVLALALVHHVCVSDGIPPERLAALLAELTTGTAIIEFVAPEDPMFRLLCRGRLDLFAGLTRGRFEKAFEPYFECLTSDRVNRMDRWMYLFRRRPGAQ